MIRQIDSDGGKNAGRGACFGGLEASGFVDAERRRERRSYGGHEEAHHGG